MNERYEIKHQINTTNGEPLFDIVTCKDCGLGPVMDITAHEKFHDRLDAISRMAVQGESAYWYNQPLG